MSNFTNEFVIPSDYVASKSRTSRKNEQNFRFSDTPAQTERVKTSIKVSGLSPSKEKLGLGPRNPIIGSNC